MFFFETGCRNRTRFQMYKMFSNFNPRIWAYAIWEYVVRGLMQFGHMQYAPYNVAF